MNQQEYRNTVNIYQEFLVSLHST